MMQNLPQHILLDTEDFTLMFIHQENAESIKKVKNESPKSLVIIAIKSSGETLGKN